MTPAPPSGQARKHPHGRLRVLMPSSLGRQHIPLLMPEFLRQYPGVSVELCMTDTIVDLIDEGIDLAIRIGALNIRIGALKDSTLVARELASNRRVLCASPAYFAEHGTPRHSADLAQHECVILADQRDWAFVTLTGVIDVRVSGRLTDNGEVIRDAVAAGIGIGLKSTWSVAPRSAQAANSSPYWTTIRSRLWRSGPSIRAARSCRPRRWRSSTF